MVLFSVLFVQFVQLLIDFFPLLVRQLLPASAVSVSGSLTMLSRVAKLVLRPLLS